MSEEDAFPKTITPWHETVHGLLEVLLMSGVIWGMPILFVPYQEVIDENKCNNEADCISSMMFIQVMYTVASCINALSMFGVGIFLTRVRNLNIVIELGILCINLSTGFLIFAYKFGSDVLFGIGLLLQGTFSPFIYQPSLIKCQMHQYAAIVSSVTSFFNSVSSLVPVVVYYTGGIIFALAYLGVCSILLFWGIVYAWRDSGKSEKNKEENCELEIEEDEVNLEENNENNERHDLLIDTKTVGECSNEYEKINEENAESGVKQKRCKKCTESFSFIKAKWFITLASFCICQLFTSTMFTASINSQLAHRGVTDSAKISENITIFYTSQACAALFGPLIGLGIKKFGPVVGFVVSGLLGCVGYSLIEFGPISVGLVFLALSIPCFYAGVYNYIGSHAAPNEISVAISTAALLFGIGAFIASIVLSCFSSLDYYTIINCLSIALEFLLLAVMGPVSKSKIIGKKK